MGDVIYGRPLTCPFFYVEETFSQDNDLRERPRNKTFRIVVNNAVNSSRRA